MNYYKVISETPDFADVSKSISQNISYRAEDCINYDDVEESGDAGYGIIDIRAKINNIVIDFEFKISATVHIKTDKGDHFTPDYTTYSISDVKVEEITEMLTDESEIDCLELTREEEKELITLINKHLKTI